MTAQGSGGSELPFASALYALLPAFASDRACRGSGVGSAAAPSPPALTVASTANATIGCCSLCWLACAPSWQAGGARGTRRAPTRHDFFLLAGCLPPLERRRRARNGDLPVHLPSKPNLPNVEPDRLFRHASQVESRLHQGECPPDPSRRSALTTPPFADGHDPGGLQARSSGGDSPSRGRHLFQVLGTVRGARAPLGCWSRRFPSAHALICDLCPRLQMLDDKFTLLYFELAEGSGLKFIRAEACTAAS